jgi:hypothetical protein
MDVTAAVVIGVMMMRIIRQGRRVHRVHLMHRVHLVPMVSHAFFHMLHDPWHRFRQCGGALHRDGRIRLNREAQ